MKSVWKSVLAMENTSPDKRAKILGQDTSALKFFKMVSPIYCLLITGIKITADLPEKITLEPGRVDNIRIWDDDIRLLFKNMPNQFLDKIYLLFPDPWPKKRHASRRFVNPENLQELSRLLKKAVFCGLQPITKFTNHGPCTKCTPVLILNGQPPAAMTGNTNQLIGFKPNTRGKPFGKAAAPSF